jgi:hypothetical protein
MLFLRKLHKWLGLIIGLQLVLWAVSGVMFAWLDPDKVDGAGSVHAVEPSVLSSTLIKADPATWLSNYPAQDLYDVRAISLADRWVWRVECHRRWRARQGGRSLAAPPGPRSLRWRWSTGHCDIANAA